jgi:hypothetical protein
LLEVLLVITSVEEPKMKFDRRAFSSGLAAAMMNVGVSKGNPQTPVPLRNVSALKKPYLFNDATFETFFLTSLGRSYHLGGSVGKILYLSRQVEDGNFETGFQAFKAAGDEAKGLAESSAADGHKESAREA